MRGWFTAETGLSPSAHTPVPKEGCVVRYNSKDSFLIPDDGKRYQHVRTNMIQLLYNAARSITLPQKRSQRSRANMTHGVDAPHSNSSNDRAGNPTKACDDSDDVLTQTTQRAQAQQGIEHANDKRR